MKKGMYALKFEDEGEETRVEILGAISTDEIKWLLASLVFRLLELGADAGDIKELVDVVEEEARK